MIAERVRPGKQGDRDRVEADRVAKLVCVWWIDAEQLTRPGHAAQPAGDRHRQDDQVRRGRMPA